MNELPEVCRFLALLPAFEALPQPTLASAARGINVAYYRKGHDILTIGSANNQLHIIRSGAVQAMDSKDELVLRLAEGEYFGFHSLMNQEPVRYRCVAIEDTLLFHLAGDTFRALRRDDPEFDTHFVRALTARLLSRRSELGELGAAGASVGRLVTREPVTVEQDCSIKNAAQKMLDARVSSLMVVEEARMIGIITDRDLRSRVVACGRDIGEPVSAIMTSKPFSLEAHSHAYDAALLMMQNNVHHLPITEDGTLIGLVARSDFMRAETEHPLYLVNDLGRQHTVDGLAEVCGRLPALLARLISSKATGEQIGRFITAITDAVTRQLLRIGERRLGPAPVPYAWMALGSQARYEQSAKSDQDNALVLGGNADDSHNDYFAALAAIVNDGLNACGYVYCPGGVMASNPKWRKPLKQWKRYFSHWIDEPSEKALMHADIFFDMRYVAGDASLIEELREFIRRQAEKNQIFLAMMTRNSMGFQPPLGFFRQFVLEKSGEHRDTLNLKASGIMPIVAIARIRCLASGQMRANTRRRLRAAGAQGELSANDSQSLIDALDLIEKLRLEHQNRQMQAGEPPDNYLSPQDLSPFVRHNLKTAFQQIRTSQAALLNRFGLA